MPVADRLSLAGGPASRVLPVTKDHHAAACVLLPASRGMRRPVVSSSVTVTVPETVERKRGRNLVKPATERALGRPNCPEEGATGLR